MYMCVCVASVCVAGYIYVHALERPDVNPQCDFSGLTQLFFDRIIRLTGRRGRPRDSHGPAWADPQH